ncbi:type II toxin-antitoxin system HicB family antitoxin [Pragia fontium]|uniref:type II toxin-antitoxin system HicB family antitoxin n=1 Tax=Pragia fontium TaxID=82985 RepID=UPI0008FFC64B|nr:type II toxin-antitoxin system HicB family antitoxin [Pragia fontium]
MTKMFNYKGFHGSVDFSLEDKVLHGKIECINDLVTYEAETISDLEAAFFDAVDDYIDTCNSLGKEPNKPFSGHFNIRIGPEKHKAAHLKALSLGLSMNEFINQSIQEKLNPKTEQHIHYHSEGKPYSGTFISSQYSFNDKSSQDRNFTREAALPSLKDFH